MVLKMEFRNLENTERKTKLSRVLTFMIIVLIGMVFIFPNNELSAQEGNYTLVKRNAQTNTFCDGFGSCYASSHLGRVNYWNNTGYIPINKTIVQNPSLEPLYDYGVETGAYFAFFKSTPSTAETVKFYYNESYLDGQNPHKTGFVTYQPLTLNYRNDLNQLQQINTIQSVTGVAQNNSFEYSNAFGSGFNLIYEYWNGLLKEKLMISNFSDLSPPAQYILDGGNATVDMDFQITWKDELDIYIEGVLWDESSTKTTNQSVEFKLGNETLFFLREPFAYDSNNSRISLKYQFKKQGNKLYVLLKTDYEWLENAVYPVNIDPNTGAKHPGSDGLTNSEWANPTNAYSSNNLYAEGSSSLEHTFQVFNFGIPSGATIDGILVKVEAKAEVSNEKLYVSLSWNAGTSYTSDENYAYGTSENDHTFGNSSYLWGRNWTSSEFIDANFWFNGRVGWYVEEQILYVDDIDIRVYYDTCPCPPTDTADYDWDVDMTQSCSIPEGGGTCNLGSTGTLTFINTGYATCINTITTTDLGPFNSGQTLYMNSGCIIYVDG